LDKARSYGLTGVMLRSTGLKKDVRSSKRTTYGSYIWAGMSSYVTTNGDSLDRYNLRMAEMMESTNIVFRVLSRLSPNRKMSNTKYKIFYGNSNNRNIAEGKISMEHLIRHFKI
jgi:NADH-quinone oxidoreductase subunit D